MEMITPVLDDEVRIRIRDQDGNERAELATGLDLRPDAGALREIAELCNLSPHEGYRAYLMGPDGGATLLDGNRTLGEQLQEGLSEVDVVLKDELTGN